MREIIYFRIFRRFKSAKKILSANRKFTNPKKGAAANGKSAHYHICGRSTNVRKKLLSATFGFAIAELICRPPTFDGM